MVQVLAHMRRPKQVTSARFLLANVRVAILYILANIKPERF